MSILVIGGTGMVGGHVLRCLLIKGKAVRVLTRSADHADIIPLGANGIIGDLRKPDTLQKVPGHLPRRFHTFVEETVAAWIRDGSLEYVTMG